MPTARPSGTQARPLFRVGDHVRFRYGIADVVDGVVVEDRGCLGVRGRRLYGVRFQLTDAEPFYIELPEAEMTKVA